MSTVDISKWQGVIPVSVFQQWSAVGVDRVILKLGGGDSGRYEDSLWSTNSANARAAGMIVEGYWFNGTTDPAGDAVFATSIAGPDARIWWDAENEGSMPHWSPGQVLAAHAAIGNPQGVYMSQSVTFEAGWAPVAALLPLWEAAYFGNTPPPVGNGFNVVLWQYTSTGRLPGYGGNLDLDQELAGLAVLTATIIKPIQEDDMPRYIRNSDNGTIAIGTVGVFHVELPGPAYVTLLDGWKVWDRTLDMNLPDNVYQFVKSMSAHPAVDVAALTAALAAHLPTGSVTISDDQLQQIVTAAKSGAADAVKALSFVTVAK
jgi:hypothetical protein